jgi:drug/metabolite transporter (DMT)-like permease
MATEPAENDKSNKLNDGAATDTGVGDAFIAGVPTAEITGALSALSEVPIGETAGAPPTLSEVRIGEITGEKAASPVRVIHEQGSKVKSDITRNSTVTLAGFLITFFGSILFSTKAIIVKKAFADTPMDALSLLALRMLFSLPFFVAVAILSSNDKTNVRLTARQWLSVIVLGLFGYYLSSLFDFIGLQYISAGLERLILFLYPSFAVLINTFFFKQKISRIQIAALALTYLGIVIAYLGEMKIESGNPNFVLGSLLIFLCAITYSIYIAGSGRIIPVVGGTKFTAYAMLASTTGIFIHYLLRGDFRQLNGATEFWIYGVILALVATVIPSFMISNGMKRIGSNNVAIISSIGPVSTIVQAHFILGERIIAAQVFGTALVIGGILLTAWKKKPGNELQAKNPGSK